LLSISILKRIEKKYADRLQLTAVLLPLLSATFHPNGISLGNTTLRSLKTKSFTIDGETTALDENGRSSFQLLQGVWEGQTYPARYKRPTDSAQSVCGRSILPGTSAFGERMG
jgi:hypothetical protein